MTIAVIGGGASGTLVAAQLLRSTRAEQARLLHRRLASVLFLEGGGATGRGIAYGTRWESHLLNVRASNMSALPDDPGHLVRWAGVAPGTFVPRTRYGAYVEHVLDEARDAAAPGALFQRTRDAVTDVLVTGDGVTLTGASGLRYGCDAAVLATGFFGRNRWPGIPGAIGNPWAAGALESVPLDEPVLVLGTGLTMVDVALALEDRGFRSTILAISRRGLLPNVHATMPTPPAIVGAELARPIELAPPTELARPTARALVRAVRERVAAFARDGRDWREAVDSLRADTPRLWQALPLAEQRRFFRHARAYWEVARHRVAPEINQRLDALALRGTLRMQRARLVDLRADEAGLRAVLRTPDGGVQSRLFGAAIDCSGPFEDYRRIDDPLVTALRVRGLARPHPLGMGWETAADGALIDDAGRASTRLFTLGPPRRGDLFESTAIPEIRVQAAALAARLLSH